MNKTEATKRALTRLLRTLCSNVYHLQAPDDEAFPYIVYEIRELSHDDGKTLIQLEVNAIDYGKNTAVVDNLADAVQSALHKYYYIDPFIEFAAYKGSRQSVQEEDKQVLRRRMLFEVHLHELKGE